MNGSTLTNGRALKCGAHPNSEAWNVGLSRDCRVRVGVIGSEDLSTCFRISQITAVYSLPNDLFIHPMLLRPLVLKISTSPLLQKSHSRKAAHNSARHDQSAIYTSSILIDRCFALAASTPDH